MEIDLTGEQRAHLELVSLYAAKPAGQVLLEAAEYLLTRDARHWQSTQVGMSAEGIDPSIDGDALIARLNQLLGR